MGLLRKLVLAGVLAGLTVAAWAGTAEPAGKTAEYYRLLLKRPRPGYLFERFCNSWLEEHEMQELQAFLESKRTENPASLLLLSFYYDRAGDPVQALTLCDEAVGQDPDGLDARFYRAQLLEGIGSFDQAAADLETVIGQEGRLQADAMKLLARVYIRLDRVDEGLAVLEALSAQQRNDSDLLDEIIDLKVDEGLYDQALADCSTLMESSGNAQHRIMLALRKASIQMRLDRTDDALATLDGVLDSVAAGSWIEREILRRMDGIYRRQQHVSGLADHYAALLEVHPGNLELMRQTASVALELGNYKTALEQGRELLRLAPMDPEIREFYVELLRECGHSAEAVEIVEGMLRNQPEHNELRIRLAGLHAEAGAAGRIRPLMLEYLEQSPKQVYDYFQVARTLVRLGEKNDAAQIYLECLAAYPDSLEAREELAYHMVRDGLYHLAAKHLAVLERQGDEALLMRVANMLCGAQRGSEAYVFLSGRRQDFAHSPRYLEALYQTMLSMPEEERPEGQPLAMAWLKASDTLDSMHRAAYAVLNEVRRAGSGEAFRRTLESMEERSMPETYLFSRILLEQGDLDLAWDVIDQALAADAGKALLWEIRLEQAQAVHDRDRSMQCLQRLEELAPKQRMIWIKEMIDLLMETEDYDAAMARLQQWKQVASGNPQIYLRECRILVARGEPDEAVARLRRAAFRMPDRPELRERLAGLYAEQGRLMEAEQVHWSLVDSDVELDERLARFNRLLELVRWSARLDAVMAEIKTRVAANRMDAFALLALAECHRALDDTDARNEALLKVLELRPDDTRTMRIIAQSEMQAGQYDHAMSLMRQVARKEKDDRVLLDLARLFLHHGEPERGLKILREECTFKDAGVLVEACGAMLAGGALDELDELLSARMADFPADFRLPFLHAVVLEESGQSQAAAEAFCRLLGVKTELPGVQPMQIISSASEWIPLDELPTMKRLFEIFELEGQVYAYRNERRRGQPAPDPYPGMLCELMPYVVNHLVKLMPMLEQNGQDAVRLALRQADVPYTKILLADDLEYASSAGQWWMDMLDAHAGDVELAYLAAVVGMDEDPGEEGFFNGEQRDRIYRLLEEDYPTGALCALLSGPPLTDEQRVKVPGLLKRCSEKHATMQSNRMAVFRLLSACEDPDMSDELKAAFLDYALGLPDDQLEEQFQLLSRLGEYRIMADKIVRRFEEDRGKPASNRYTGSMGALRRGDCIEPLYFPPGGLVPDWLGTVKEINDEKLREALESAEDPLLRLCLLHSELEPSALTAAVQEIEAGMPPGFDKNLLLGTWYAGQQESAKALDYLIRARHAAPTTELRMGIDGAILDRVLFLDELSAEQQRECQAAALRISGRFLSRKDTVLLTELRHRLGMAETVPVRSAVSIPRSTGRSSAAVTVQDRIENMISKGETDRALREAVGVLRRYMNDQVMLDDAEHSSREFDECMTLVADAGLTDRFLECLKVDEDASARDRMALALACESMDRLDAAVEQYRVALDLQPNWSGVRFRLAMLTTEPIGSARELLDGLDSKQVGIAVSRLCSDLDGAPLNQYLQHLELLPGLVRKLSENAHPYIAIRLLESINDKWTDDADSTNTLPELLDEKISDEKPAEPVNPVLEAARQRRIAIYLDLCDILMERPTMARTGFIRKMIYLRLHNLDTEPLFEQAGQVLTVQKPGFDDEETYGYDHEPEALNLPEFFFAAECARRGQRDRLDQLLPKVLDPGSRIELEKLGRYFFADEEEFKELLIKLIKAVASDDYRDQERLDRLLMVYNQRDLTFDLMPVLLDQIDPDNGDSIRAVGMGLDFWMQVCAEAGRPEEGAAAMLQYLRRLFPPDEVAQILAGTVADDDDPAEVLRMRLNIVRDRLGDFSCDISSWMPLVDLIVPVLRACGQNSALFDSYWRELDDVTPEIILQTPFINDWESFTSYSLDEQSSLLSSLLRKIDDPAVLSNAVARVNPATFGSRLLGILAREDVLEPDQIAAELAGLSAEYVQRIDAGDAFRQDDLFNLFSVSQKYYGWDTDVKMIADPAAAVFWQRWADRQTVSEQQAAAVILEGSALQQADRRNLNLRDAGRTVRLLASPDPVTARNLLERMIETKDLSNRMSRYSKGYYEDVAEQVYGDVIDKEYPGKAAVQLLLDTAYENGLAGGWLELDDMMGNELASPFFKRKRLARERDGLAADEAAFAAAVETLQELDRVTASRGCPPVIQAVAGLPERGGDPARLVAWLDSDAAAPLKHRALYRFVLDPGTGNAEALAALIGDRREPEAVRGAFALRLFSSCPGGAMKNSALVDAAYAAATALPPELYLANDGFANLVQTAPALPDTDQLYTAWLETHRQHKRFASRENEISLLVASRLIDAGRTSEAGIVLVASNDSSLSAAVLWGRLRNAGEVVDCLQNSLSKARRNVTNIWAVDVAWTREDAAWFLQQVEGWAGEDGRFVRMASLTVPVAGASMDVASFVEAFKAEPFTSDNLGMNLLDLAESRAGEGELDELLVTACSEQLLRKFIKSGHGASLRRVQSYARVLARLNDQERMRELLRLHEEYNREPGCMHEEEMRGTVLQCAAQLGLEPEPE